MEGVECADSTLYEIRYYQGFAAFLVEDFNSSIDRFYEAIKIGGPWDDQILYQLWKTMDVLGDTSSQDFIAEQLIDMYPESEFTQKIVPAKKKTKRASTWALFARTGIGWDQENAFSGTENENTPEFKSGIDGMYSGNSATIRTTQKFGKHQLQQALGLGYDHSLKENVSRDFFAKTDLGYGYTSYQFSLGWAAAWHEPPPSQFDTVDQEFDTTGQEVDNTEQEKWSYLMSAEIEKSVSLKGQQSLGLSAGWQMQDVDRHYFSLSTSYLRFIKSMLLWGSFRFVHSIDLDSYSDTIPSLDTTVTPPPDIVYRNKFGEDEVGVNIGAIWEGTKNEFEIRTGMSYAFPRYESLGSNQIKDPDQVLEPIDYNLSLGYEFKVTRKIILSLQGHWSLDLENSFSKAREYFDSSASIRIQL